MSAPPKYTDEPTPNSAGHKTYGSIHSTSSDPSSKPLLPSSPRLAPSAYPGASSSSQSNANAWTHQPAEDDLPEDFKLGVVVIDCDAAIRLAFIRKVYSILFVQLLCTAIVGCGMSTHAAVEYTHANPWVIWVPMIGSFVSLLATYWKRHDFPLNLVMLGLFTVFEAVMVGAVTSYYESRIVLQAILITVGVFTGLTLFTFQTKLDFSSMYPFLFAGIWGMITASLVHVFIPFSSTLDLVIGSFGVVLFSGFILYDTQQIMKRYSIDEWVVASLALYLDAINLFLSVLRVLNSSER